MGKRLCVTPLVGLVLTFGIVVAADPNADQKDAIEAIQKLKGFVGGDPPDNVTLTGRKNANAAMMYVDKLPTLTAIYASKSDVADDGLAKVKGLTKLTILSLANTKITDKGLENLKGLSKLETLDLHGTEIGDEGIAYLKGLPALGVLNLKGTKVTDAGVAELRKTLPKIIEIRRD
jgi:hypothetical protein